MRQDRGEKLERVPRPDARLTFEDAYRKHLVSMKNIVWRYARTAADAEDLLQEASLKAFSHWDRFDPSIAKFTTWFATIVRNCAIDEYRKMVARPILEIEERAMEGVVDPQFGHDPYSSEMRALHGSTYAKPAQIAVDALMWLPQDQREVIELEAEGVSQMQMEVRLREPLGTIKSRVRIARVKLRKMLASRGVTAETLFGT